MLRLIVIKELVDTALSPRFVTMFAIGIVLVLLSLYTGLENHAANRRYNSVATELMRETVPNQVNWSALAYWGEYRVYKEPSAVGVLVSGIENDVGRNTAISIYDEPVLQDPKHNEHPVFAIFGGLDFLFGIKIVFSLLAMLFTYDAVCGERERGTLKLMLANSLPRDRVLLGKFAGSLIGVGIPMLLSMLVVVLVLWVHPAVQLTAAEWLRTGLLMGTCFLYVACFLSLGLWISGMSRRTSTAFLVQLVVWVLLVLVIPKSSVLLAGHAVNVPTSAEIHESKEELNRQSYREYMSARDKWLREHPGETRLPADVQEKINREREETRDRASARIDEAYMQRQIQQERLARTMGRVSPAGCLTFAALELADTGLERKRRFLDAARAHRSEFSDWIAAHLAEERRSDDPHGAKGRLDVSDMPRFHMSEPAVASLLAPAALDVGTLAVMTLLFFGLAYRAFRSYDPR